MSYLQSKLFNIVSFIFVIYIQYLTTKIIQFNFFSKDFINILYFTKDDISFVN